MEDNEPKLEKKVEDILVNKTKLVYGIVVATVVIATLFFKIQLDVALIKQNHEAHMETIEKEILNLQKQQDANLSEHDKIINKYDLLSSKIDQLIGKLDK